MEWRVPLGDEQPSLVSNFVCGGLDCPTTVLAKFESIGETTLCVGSSLSSSPSLEIEYDGNQSI